MVALWIVLGVLGYALIGGVTYAVAERHLCEGGAVFWGLMWPVTLFIVVPLRWGAVLAGAIGEHIVERSILVGRATQKWLLRRRVRRIRAEQHRKARLSKTEIVE